MDEITAPYKSSSEIDTHGAEDPDARCCGFRKKDEEEDDDDDEEFLAF